MSVNQFGKLFNRNPAKPDGAAVADEQKFPVTGAKKGAPTPARQAEAVNPAQEAPEARQQESSPVGDLIALPLLPRRTAPSHQRFFLVLLALGIVALVLIIIWALRQADRSAHQIEITGQSLMQSQRVAKLVSQVMLGDPKTFADLTESSGTLVRGVHALNDGNAQIDVYPLSDAFKPELDSINPESSTLLEIAETISSLKLQQNAPAAEISAAGQLVMLTQRIGKSANEFQTIEGVSPQAVFMLGKDLKSFKEITQGLLDGSVELRLTATKDDQTREQLQELAKIYEQTRTQDAPILGTLRGLVSAREAQAAIIADSAPLRRQLEAVQAKLTPETGLGAGHVAALVLAGLFVLLCGIGISRVQLLDSRARQAAAETQQKEARRQEQEAKRQELEAKRQELEAKRVNDANQAAILLLMDELQSVAEGDLTQEATVTEDITGAIADSVNYTVEELRQLVGNVQNTATQVAQTTAQVDNTSTELLAASTEQLREIRETGRSVLDMATRINEVSAQAQESATVARQSLQAADSGLQAVQNAIGGMNSIRDQIQDTSKRIKRLGESSQEIGEITELISDITEQTNVLALNAAIQAASAGEAGRGFSVVAEEVQRLAERSADATRQISALVKAIQTDTQDAVAAMERSTRGVGEGPRLSDSAGTALTEIDRVSRRLAELIEQISSSASKEAVLANVVADNIQHIFAVTEQTGEGTRSTAQQGRELSRMAEELRH